MSQPYVGEIRIMACNFAPSGWNLCDGTLLAISEYETLYNLIGTTYGGDGQSTFAVPDLRGRAPVHIAGSFPIGQVAGQEAVTLTQSQIPSHSHAPQAATGVVGNTSSSPQNNVWSASPGGPYSSQAPTLSLSSVAIGQAGGSQPHDNMPPFVVLNFVISLFGVYPSPS